MSSRSRDGHWMVPVSFIQGTDWNLGLGEWADNLTPPWAILLPRVATSRCQMQGMLWWYRNFTKVYPEKSICSKDALMSEPRAAHVHFCQTPKWYSTHSRDFPGGPWAKTPYSQCRGPRINPRVRPQGTRSHRPQLRVCMLQLQLLHVSHD